MSYLQKINLLHDDLTLHLKEKLFVSASTSTVLLHQLRNRFIKITKRIYEIEDDECYEKLLDCCYLFVDGVLIHNTGFCITSVNLKNFWCWLEVLLSVSQIKNPRRNIIGIFYKLLNTDTEVPIWCTREILHIFNKCLNYLNKESCYKFIEQNMYEYIYKLTDLLCSCGDFDQQFQIIKYIHNICSKEQIKKHINAIFPENEEYCKQFLDIKDCTFYQNVRSFLKTLNNKGDLVYSIQCKIISLDKVCVSTLSETDNWVDFNMKSDTISIYCSKNVFLNLPCSSSTNGECNEFEILFLPADYVDFVTEIEQNNKNYVHIKFGINKPLITRNSDCNNEYKVKALNLFVAKSNDTDVLLCNVLPWMFNKKFSINTALRGSQQLSNDEVLYDLVRCSLNNMTGSVKSSIPDNEINIRNMVLINAKDENIYKKQRDSAVLSPSSNLYVIEELSEKKSQSITDKQREINVWTNEVNIIDLTQSSDDEDTVCLLETENEEPRISSKNNEMFKVSEICESVLSGVSKCYSAKNNERFTVSEIHESVLNDVSKCYSATNTFRLFETSQSKTNKSISDGDSYSCQASTEIPFENKKAKIIDEVVTIESPPQLSTSKTINTNRTSINTLEYETANSEVLEVIPSKIQSQELEIPKENIEISDKQKHGGKSAEEKIKITNVIKITPPLRNSGSGISSEHNTSVINVSSEYQKTAPSINHVSRICQEKTEGSDMGKRTEQMKNKMITVEPNKEVYEELESITQDKNLLLSLTTQSDWDKENVVPYKNGNINILSPNKGTSLKPKKGYGLNSINKRTESRNGVITSSEQNSVKSAECRTSGGNAQNITDVEEMIEQTIINDLSINTNNKKTSVDCKNSNIANINLSCKERIHENIIYNENQTEIVECIELLSDDEFPYQNALKNVKMSSYDNEMNKNDQGELLNGSECNVIQIVEGQENCIELLSNNKDQNVLENFKRSKNYQTNKNDHNELLNINKYVVNNDGKLKEKCIELLSDEEKQVDEKSSKTGECAHENQLKEQVCTFEKVPIKEKIIFQKKIIMNTTNVSCPEVVNNFKEILSDNYETQPSVIEVIDEIECIELSSDEETEFDRKKPAEQINVLEQKKLNGGDKFEHSAKARLDQNTEQELTNTILLDENEKSDDKFDVMAMDSKTHQEIDRSSLNIRENETSMNDIVNDNDCETLLFKSFSEYLLESEEFLNDNNKQLCQQDEELVQITGQSFKNWSVIRKNKESMKQQKLNNEKEEMEVNNKKELSFENNNTFTSNEVEESLNTTIRQLDQQNEHVEINEINFGDNSNEGLEQPNSSSKIKNRSFNRRIKKSVEEPKINKKKESLNNSNEQLCQQDEELVQPTGQSFKNWSVIKKNKESMKQQKLNNEKVEMEVNNKKELSFENNNTFTSNEVEESLNTTIRQLDQQNEHVEINEINFGDNSNEGLEQPNSSSKIKNRSFNRRIKKSVEEPKINKKKESLNNSNEQLCQQDEELVQITGQSFKNWSVIKKNKKSMKQQKLNNEKEEMEVNNKKELSFENNNTFTSNEVEESLNTTIRQLDQQNEHVEINEINFGDNSNEGLEQPNSSSKIKNRSFNRRIKKSVEEPKINKKKESLNNSNEQLCQQDEELVQITGQSFKNWSGIRKNKESMKQQKLNNEIEEMEVNNTKELSFENNNTFTSNEVEESLNTTIRQLDQLNEHGEINKVNFGGNSSEELDQPISPSTIKNRSFNRRIKKSVEEPKINKKKESLNNSNEQLCQQDEELVQPTGQSFKNWSVIIKNKESMKQQKLNNEKDEMEVNNKEELSFENNNSFESNEVEESLNATIRQLDQLNEHVEINKINFGGNSNEDLEQPNSSSKIKNRSFDRKIIKSVQEPKINKKKESLNNSNEQLCQQDEELVQPTGQSFKNWSVVIKNKESMKQQKLNNEKEEMEVNNKKVLSFDNNNSFKSKEVEESLNATIRQLDQLNEHGKINKVNFGGNSSEELDQPISPSTIKNRSFDRKIKKSVEKPEVHNKKEDLEFRNGEELKHKVVETNSSFESNRAEEPLNESIEQMDQQNKHHEMNESNFSVQLNEDLVKPNSPPVFTNSLYNKNVKELIINEEKDNMNVNNRVDVEEKVINSNDSIKSMPMSGMNRSSEGKNNSLQESEVIQVCQNEVCRIGVESFTKNKYLTVGEVCDVPCHLKNEPEQNCLGETLNGVNFKMESSSSKTNANLEQNIVVINTQTENLERQDDTNLSCYSQDTVILHSQYQPGEDLVDSKVTNEFSPAFSFGVEISDEINELLQSTFESPQTEHFISKNPQFSEGILKSPIAASVVENAKVIIGLQKSVFKDSVVILTRSELIEQMIKTNKSNEKNDTCNIYVKEKKRKVCKQIEKPKTPFNDKELNDAQMSVNVNIRETNGEISNDTAVPKKFKSTKVARLNDIKIQSKCLSKSECELNEYPNENNNVYALNVEKTKHDAPLNGDGISAPNFKRSNYKDSKAEAKSYSKTSNKNGCEINVSLKENDAANFDETEYENNLSPVEKNLVDTPPNPKKLKHSYNEHSRSIVKTLKKHKSETNKSPEKNYTQSVEQPKSDLQRMKTNDVDAVNHEIFKEPKLNVLKKSKLNESHKENSDLRIKNLEENHNMKGNLYFPEKSNTSMVSLENSEFNESKSRSSKLMAKVNLLGVLTAQAKSNDDHKQQSHSIFDQTNKTNDTYKPRKRKLYLQDDMSHLNSYELLPDSEKDKPVVGRQKDNKAVLPPKRKRSRYGLDRLFNQNIKIEKNSDLHSMMFSVPEAQSSLKKKRSGKGKVSGKLSKTANVYVRDNNKNHDMKVQQNVNHRKKKCEYSDVDNSFRNKKMNIVKSSTKKCENKNTNSIKIIQNIIIQDDSTNQLQDNDFVKEQSDESFEKEVNQQFDQSSSFEKNMESGKYFNGYDKNQTNNIEDHLRVNNANESRGIMVSAGFIKNIIGSLKYITEACVKELKDKNSDLQAEFETLCKVYDAFN